MSRPRGHTPAVRVYKLHWHTGWAWHCRHCTDGRGYRTWRAALHGAMAHVTESENYCAEH